MYSCMKNFILSSGSPVIMKSGSIFSKANFVFVVENIPIRIFIVFLFFILFMIRSASLKEYISKEKTAISGSRLFIFFIC